MLIGPMRLLAALALITAPFVGCGSDSGYNDPDALAARLSERAQVRMDKDPGTYKGAKVTETKCVKSGEDRVFKCSGEISTGEHWTITVTVSDDGKTYVSDQ